jgi:hypothetical protein
MANALPRSKQVDVVVALTEGCSMRSVSRMTGVDRQTVGTLLARVGEGCSALLDDTMVNLPCTALTIAAYNFVRVNRTLRCSPAMAAGVSKTLWSTEDLVDAALDGVRP